MSQLFEVNATKFQLLTKVRDAPDIKNFFDLVILP